MSSLYVTLLLLFFVVETQPYSSKERRGIPLTLRGSAKELCLNGSTASLKPMQRQICEQYKKTHDVVYEALALAVDECRAKLKDYPWNCSGINASHILQHKGMMQTDTLESAYVHALTSSAIMFKVTRTCLLGNPYVCHSSKELRRYTVTRTACSYNFTRMQAKLRRMTKNRSRPSYYIYRAYASINLSIKNERKTSCCLNYAEKTTRRFLDPVSPGAESLLMRHNYKAGRKIVREMICDSIKIQGKCLARYFMYYGCPGEYVYFKDVSKYIYTKLIFREARQVHLIQKTKTLASVSARRIRLTSLVYTNKSPNFCRADPTLGILGTEGKRCSEKKSAVNYCGSYCCGPYSTKTKSILVKCHCKFYWCCKVKCKLCKKTIVEHRCLSYQPINGTKVV